MSTAVKVQEVQIMSTTGSAVVGDLPEETVNASLAKVGNRGIKPEEEGDEVLPRKRKKTSGIMCIDLVEDQMRSRLVAVFAALAAYLIVGSEFIRFSEPPQDEHVARIMFASTVPTFGYLGPRFAERTTTLTVVSTRNRAYSERRCPSVNETRCAEDSNYSEPVYTRARVTDITYNVDPSNTLRCDTATMARMAGTLDALVRKKACTPTLSVTGSVSASDAAGVASFPELAITGGPPGVYTIAFTAGKDALDPSGPTSSSAIQLSARTNIQSHIAEIVPLNSGSGVVTRLGVPLPRVPRVLVIDANGAPCPNRTVFVWSSSVPNIYRAWDRTPQSFPGVDYADLGRVTNHIRGQVRACAWGGGGVGSMLHVVAALSCACAAALGCACVAPRALRPPCTQPFAARLTPTCARLCCCVLRAWPCSLARWRRPTPKASPNSTSSPSPPPPRATRTSTTIARGRWRAGTTLCSDRPRMESYLARPSSSRR